MLNRERTGTVLCFVTYKRTKFTVKQAPRPFFAHPFQHRLKQRAMTIVGTSHHGSGGSGTSSAPPKVVARLDGLPKGHDKVTTYGGGGGTPIHIKSGPLKGWRVGGGKRGKVFGTT